MTRRWLAGALVVAALAYLALRPLPEPGAGVLKRDLLAMGTLVSLSVHLGPGVDRAVAEAALDQTERELLGFEHTWAPWGDGLLGDINRTLAQGSAFQLTGSLGTLFTLSERLRADSGGHFDARLGALVRLWGFDDESRFRSEPPPDADVDALRAALAAAPAYAAGAPYGPAPEVQWDFGGIAKGAAVDAAVEGLHARGLRDVIVNAGGNLRASGRHGDRPWRIGIRHPRASAPDTVLAALEIQGDEAVVTSGDYERWFEHGGRRYHHVLDPATGRPARGLQAASVLHASAAWADAASTALLVAGAGWREVARRLGIEAALVVDASGVAHVTGALAPRLRFAEGVVPVVVP